METKTASLRSMKICRFCLSQDETLTSIYDKKIYSSSRNSFSLTVQIMACLSVEAFPSDGLPCHICERCRFFMDHFYHFKQMCRQADERILLHIEDGFGNILLPLQWPKKLSRLYNTLQSIRKKSNKVKTVKTDSGATVQVQVTAADLMSDSDAEEEENTFKISIDENYHEDDPNSIKVVKSSIQLLNMTNEQSFFNPITAQTEDKKFTCNICSKVFACYNYYTRHMHVRHKGHVTASGPRGPFGEYELYRCDQCDEMFPSQDGLIYHSAKHATENLTCPLCQEKFQQVEEVSEHIKTHVDGAEFMCDLCELVFTTKEKLDQHLLDKHGEELRQEQELGLEDDSSEEEEEEDDNIRIKEENGQTVVEVTQKFMDSTPGADVTNSEESDTEAPTPVQAPPMIARKVEPPSLAKADQNKPVSILKKVEEMKRKSLQRQTPSPAQTPTPQKQAKPAAAAKKVENSLPAATADKSLRLLEKELQELQRTNTNRAESSKPPAKNNEPQRPKRSHTNTPKARPQEEKKLANSTKTPVPEKKPERRVAAAAAVVTKENKEPKESKETKVAALKEDKVIDSEIEKEKELKETPNAKATPKTKASDVNLRRSSRSGKVKDYAKMINEKSSDESTDDDEEYIGAPTRARKSNASTKGTPQPVFEESPVATTGNTRKRGRPRKGNKTDALPAKVMKIAEDEGKQSEEDESDPLESAPKEYKATKVIRKVPEPPAKEVDVEEPPKSPEKETLSSEKKTEVIKSPSGQTLKKVPVKALPPGIKPLPLPTNARPVQPGELCEMQIGKKMVKVQKIVMTKAEVEAMAKKGLVEVKHGTMVLKQGIKLPTSDAASIKTTLMSEANKDNAEKNE